MNGQEQREVARWYTLARRFPQLIGKTADGTRLWGGPYTFSQVIVAALLLLLLTQTTWLWARSGFFGNLVLFVALLGVPVYLVGKLPFGMRNPLVLAAGWLRIMSPTRTGTVGGVQVKLRRPHQAHSRVVMITTQIAPVEDITEPAAVADIQPIPIGLPQPNSTPASVHQPPRLSLTGVQLLLAQTVSPEVHP